MEFDKLKEWIEVKSDVQIRKNTLFYPSLIEAMELTENTTINDVKFSNLPIVHQYFEVVESWLGILKSLAESASSNSPISLMYQGYHLPKGDSLEKFLSLICQLEARLGEDSQY